MITFDAVAAIKFGPFDQLQLGLANRGLLFIRGENNDTSSADSNGAGKSHILKAVTWCLYGETTEGDKGDRVIQYGATGCKVSVSWVDESGAWSVTREKDRGTSGKLLFEHNDQDISAPTMAGTQAEINKRLGMDFATWRNTVLYAQGDVVRFADPATTDSERKLILKRILRLDVLDKASEQAKAKIKALEAELSKLTNEAASVLAELRGLEAAGDLQAQLKAAEGEVKDLEAKFSKVSKYRSLESQVQEAIREIRERFDDRAADIEAEQRAVGEANIAESVANERARTARSAQTNVQSAQARFKDGKCPTCGTKTSAPSVKACVQELADKLLAAKTAETEATVAAAAAAESAAEAKRRVAAIKQEVAAAKAEIDAEVAEWQPKLAEVRREITVAEQAGIQAGAARRRAESIRQKLKAVGDRRAVLEARGREIATTNDQLVVDKLHLEFWLKGFSNSGVPSYLMDNVVPELSERANKYLELLADADIRVQFDTQTKLKSGDNREKLSISWIIEGIPDATPSGGQRKKISIAVDLALMDLVAARERAAIDLLMVDEVLDGLDSAGRSRVMQLLGELRQKRSTILVISHDSTLAELFEHSVLVKKTGSHAQLEDES